MVATANEPVFCDHCGGRQDSRWNGNRFVDGFEETARRAADAFRASPGQRSPALAAFLSFVIPGLGQLYNGEGLKGFVLFITSIFVLPWVVAVVDAYYTARIMNLEEAFQDRGSF